MLGLREIILSNYSASRRSVLQRSRALITVYHGPGNPWESGELSVQARRQAARTQAQFRCRSSCSTLLCVSVALSVKYGKCKHLPYRTVLGLLGDETWRALSIEPGTYSKRPSDVRHCYDCRHTLDCGLVYCQPRETFFLLNTWVSTDDNGADSAGSGNNEMTLLSIQMLLFTLGSRAYTLTICSS